jgi:CheY-like chemotaxis protein
MLTWRFRTLVPEQDLPMPRILVVEDDESSRSLIARILQRLDYETLEATNGLTALNILEADSAFDLIITDVRMSPVDGMNLLDQVKQLYHHIPVLMISVHGRPEWISEAQDKGASGFLLKPFVKSELAEAVYSILAPINP